jgi:hypothetical protein
MKSLVSSLMILWCGMNLLMPEARAAEEISKYKTKVDAFVSKGMFTPLKDCDLPVTCQGKRYLKQQRRKFQTSNDSDVDQRELSFDGMKVILRYVLAASYPVGKVTKPYSKPPEILQVRITKSHWSIDHGLRVGVSRTTVIQRLGRGQEYGKCLLYINEERQDEVQFCFRAERVESIEWTPWNDA